MSTVIKDRTEEWQKQKDSAVRCLELLAKNMAKDEVQLEARGNGGEFVRPTKHTEWFRFNHNGKPITIAVIGE